MNNKVKIKNSLDDLAIMGGDLLFDRKLHVGYPEIGDRNHFLKMVNDILDRRWLTNNGPYVCQFEERIAKFTGVAHCIAVCNATIGLELVIRALGLKGEVILPAMTFIATAQALQWQGIKPVFCDISPETFCIDPCQIDNLITPETTGIIGVHLFGRVCQVEQLQKLANKHRIKLLFDAAHAFGCSRDQKIIGCFGNAEVLSFHATKVVNSFEGGAVLTNDDSLAEKLRLIRNFGFKDMDNVAELGINGKMNEVSAAMGIVSFEAFQKFVEINKRNYELYNKLLSDIPGISLMKYDLREKNNFQYIVLSVNEKISGISRDALMLILRAENILARRYFYPGCHRMQPYCFMYSDGLDSLLPVTDKLNKEIMQLPSGSSIEPLDIEKICGLIRFSIANSQGIKKHLSRMPKIEILKSVGGRHARKNNY